MRGALPIVVAALLASAAYSYQMVAPSGRALACYCAQSTDPLIQTARHEPVTIVAGTVGAAQQDRTLIVVDSWFHGPFATDRLWVAGGTGSSSSCDLLIGPGERRVLVLWGGPSSPGANGLYSTDVCQRSGLVGTADGDALLAEAFEAFSPPAVPDAAPTSDQGVSRSLNAEEWLWIGLGSAAGMALLALLVIRLRRRPSPP